MRILAILSLVVLLGLGVFAYWQWDQVQQELAAVQQELRTLQQRLTRDTDPEEAIPQPSPSRPITVYFVEMTATDFVLRPEIHSVDPPVTLAKAVEALITGPKSEELHPVMPPGTRLLSVEIQDTTAVVNFSAELRENFNMGSQGEALLLQSLMRTAAAFSNIAYVQILVEGSIIESIGGHIAIDTKLQISDF